MAKKREIPETPNVPGTQVVNMDGIVVTAKEGERGVTAADFNAASEVVNAEQIGRVRRAQKISLIRRLINGITGIDSSN